MAPRIKLGSKHRRTAQWAKVKLNKVGWHAAQKLGLFYDVTGTAMVLDDKD